MADPAEALELGRFAYADDRLDDARQHFEAAFDGFKEDGNGCAAARAATVLSQLHGDMLGNHAAARGWSERTRRLLDEVGPCVEWGYYELARMACDRPDVDDLAAGAERARQLAIEYGDQASRSGPWPTEASPSSARGRSKRASAASTRRWRPSAGARSRTHT